MYEGRTLQELATEVMRRAEAKRDFVAPINSMQLVEHDGVDEPLFQMEGVDGAFGVQEMFRKQLADRMGVPERWSAKMFDDYPDLFRDTFNYLFDNYRNKKGQEPTQLVRTLDDGARAFLSNSYRPLDNEDLAEIIIPKLESVDAKIVSCEITDRRMYLKATTERVTGEVKQGDIVQGGLVISNSEVGAGSLKIEPLMYRLACLNGMIVAEAAMRKAHVTSKYFGGDGASEFFKDDTRRKTDDAFWSQVRDTVDAVLTQETFDVIVGRARAATQEVLNADPIQVVEVFAKEEGLIEREKNSVLKHLIQGNDISKWGLVNAVTSASKEADNYARATEMERLGGKVMEYAPSKFSALSRIANKGKGE